MRILFVIEGIQESCGISRFVIETARELMALGHDAVIVSTKNWNVPADDLHIFETQKPEVTASEFHPDIVHLHGCWNGYVHRMARWCQKHNIPYVFSPHGAWTLWAMEFHKWKKKLAWLLFQKHDALKAAAFHVTVQSEWEDVIRLGFTQDIIIAPLGVRQSKTTLSPIANREKVLLYLGRLHEKKNVHGLLETWQQIPPNIRSDWKLVIAGKPGPDNPSYLTELKEKADRDCQFVGEVTGKAKDALYQSARIFILPSFSENFGAVVIEALAAGTPVIASTGTPWETLEKNHCGWWISPEKDSLQNALASIMQYSNDKLQMMSENAQYFVHRYYSWQHTAEILIQAYEKVLTHG